MLAHQGSLQVSGRFYIALFSFFWSIVIERLFFRTKRRRLRLRNWDLSTLTNKTTTPDENDPPNNFQGIAKSEKRTDRTTRMLVAVLLLFLITEIPQGILGLLSGVLGDCFFRSCYHNFGEIMDILALLNGAINFILYCSMSRQFRTTFGQLFKPRILRILQHTDLQSTMLWIFFFFSIST